MSDRERQSNGGTLQSTCARESGRAALRYREQQVSNGAAWSFEVVFDSTAMLAGYGAVDRVDASPVVHSRLASP